MIKKNTSVSHATLRPEHLIPCFMGVLRDAAHDAYVRHFPEYQRIKENGLWETEEASYLIEDLFDDLYDIAPDGCYFGANMGDGSDFGFWELDD